MSEYLMPYGGPTRTTRNLGRVFLILSYTLSFLVSVGDLLAPSAILKTLTPRGWTVTMAIILALLSLLGLISVSTRRWRIEWVAATAITFLLLERSVPVWARLFNGFPESTSAAAMMTLGTFCLAQRALSLWVFSIRTRQTAENARDAG